MLGAIYTGLSGMTAYSNGLQVISNNVANLNTLGFKETNVAFQDIFSNSGGGGLTYLGSGSQSSGNGVKIAPSTIDFSQGTLQQSNGDLDLAIQGTGFLVVQSGDKTLYTRTGQFVVDSKGFISQQGTDNHLMVLDAAGQPVAPNIDAKRTSTPVATTKIAFADNLSSTGTTATVSNVAVYDSNGGKHVWTVTFTAAGAASPGQWAVAVADETGASIGSSTLKFVGSAVDPTTQTLTIATTPAGAAAQSVVLDFSKGVTSFSSAAASTLRAASVDGQGVGNLTSVTLDASGALQLAYSNGQNVSLGSVAMADFRDPQQLQRVGNGLFENRGNGEVRLLASGQDGIGQLVSKQLEASNVDLTSQFGRLILIQRGFQASSQVVSVSNDMIQQLFGIRGQG